MVILGIANTAMMMISAVILCLLIIKILIHINEDILNERK